MKLVAAPLYAREKLMLQDEGDLEFVRHATAELAISFTDQRDHNLHAAFNGLIKAIESDRARIAALEAEVAALRSQNTQSAGE